MLIRMTSASTRPTGPLLDPRLQILRRAGGGIQLGWDPERAILLTPPPGVDPDNLIAVIRMLDGRNSHPQILWHAGDRGISPADMSAILAELAETGVLDPVPATTHRICAVRIHGRGPLSDAIATNLSVSGVRVTRSAQYTVDTDVARWRAQCVVLSDDLMPDPRLVAELVRRAVPHLQVRLRDGRGIVGPLVIPGRTSCLRCADLTRCAGDEEWPYLAAQLLGRVGQASPATVLATAAVALGQIEMILTGPPRPIPASLDSTLEVDLTTHRFGIRSWSKHPECECWQSAAYLDEASTRQ